MASCITLAITSIGYLKSKRLRGRLTDQTVDVLVAAAAHRPEFRQPPPAHEDNLMLQTQAVACCGPGPFAKLQAQKLRSQVGKHVLYIIGFPERYTIMTQDVVCRDQVKVELWSSPVHSVFTAGHIEDYAIR